ncbi:MAG: hypothetical protein Q8R55_01375 [Candidatus Taylorbacteria bacterium]|nr:hypothetical protein [Candidatus Taylorbacteria bacterium]
MDEQTVSQQNISLSGISGGGEIDIYTYFTASPYFAGFTSHNSPDMKVFLGLYQTLPDSLRQFIASDVTASTIFTTGQSYDLDDEQIFILAKSIRELVVGNIFIKDFPTTMSSRLGIDDIKAEELVNKIISKSFGPIIEDVKRIQRSKFPDKISQIQKESRPTGITQPGARPLPPRPEIPSLEVEPRKSLEVQPQKPENRPLAQPQTVRPPPQMPPPTSQSQGQEAKPPYLEAQLPSNRSVESIRPPRPEAGEMGEARLKEAARPEVGEARPERAAQPTTAPRSDLPGRTDLNNGIKSQDAQKSLEQELEKVANVIDLRNKSNN